MLSEATEGKGYSMAMRIEEGDRCYTGVNSLWKRKSLCLSISKPMIRILLNLLLFVVVCVSALTSRAVAQIKTESEDSYLRFGETQIIRYQVGATIDARKGPVQKVLAMVAVPFDCPEQDVELVNEDISQHVSEIDYRYLNKFSGGGARQLLISIPYLPGGEQASVLLTFEVRIKEILPPEDTTTLSKPRKPDRELKKYLGKSPYIETKHAKIKRTLKKIDEDLKQESPEAVTDWQRVEAIYDFVQSHVKYVEGPDKSALRTLNDASGDCQNISALFVALCRTAGVPARIVWVHEHNYPEFCLVDQEGNPHWFPCESSGMRAFGEMPTLRPIMQKGDNFRVPERPREALRYASDYLIGLPVNGGGKPKVKYIRRQL